VFRRFGRKESLRLAGLGRRPRWFSGDVKRLRGEEEWARSIMSEVLGVAVSQHDDGSRPGMHDLDLLHPDRPHGAAEVTAAADGECLALWRLMNGNDERWIVPELDGGWLVSLDPAARANSVAKSYLGSCSNSSAREHHA
jgi:hypothetical protein